MSAEPRLRRIALLLLALWALAASPGHAAGERVDVKLQGLRGELRDNARAALGIVLHSGQPGLEVNSIRRLHEEATGEIERALQPFGYYRSRVDARLSPPAKPGAAWQARYRVDPGPQITIGRLDIRWGGTTDPELAALAESFPLQPGAPLDHRRYETGKRELLQSARSLGYRDARWQEHRVEVELADYRADIRLALAPGPRFEIGPVSFEQQRFDEAWLRRYLVLQPGQPYTSKALAEQRRRFGRSGYFREVEIRPLPAVPGENGRPQIPLRILLKEYPANRYRGALGWGTDTGIGVQLDWTRRYVGRRGQRFNAGVVAVEDRERLAGDINYVIPLDPADGSEVEVAARHESKDLSFEDVDLDEGGDTRISTNLLSGFWRPRLLRWGDYRISAVPGISLVTETYDVFEVLFGNLDPAAQEIIIDNIGEEAYATLAPDFEAVVPSLKLTARRADNPLFIRSGEYLGLELLGANEDLGSNITFWQATLESWLIRPAFDDDRILLRAALGYSDAESREVLGVNFNRMPEYYEYRTGGVNSIRGYGWETLVPAGSITGGKHLAVGSIEYQYQVIPDWSVALFLDGGNTYNEFDDIDPKLGTGLGVRWRSPVGMARLDIGFPLDDADDSFQVYITVGPEF